MIERDKYKEILKSILDKRNTEFAKLDAHIGTVCAYPKITYAHDEKNPTPRQDPYTRKA